MVRRCCFYSVLCAVSAGVFMMGACATEKPGDTRTVGRAAVHAVHTSNLQAVMGELGSSVQRDWPQEIQDVKRNLVERDRQKQFERAGLLAERLAHAAGSIPDAVADVEMDPAERRSFLDSAELLRDQALKLSDMASRKDIDGVRASLNQIRTTCYGCHTQFREYAGPIRFGDLD